MTADPRCCGGGTCSIEAEGRCWRDVTAAACSGRMKLAACCCTRRCRKPQPQSPEAGGCTKPLA
jgi:hypothetical protein